MCECPGYIDTVENTCDGCKYWRKKHAWGLGQACTEHIGTIARSMDRDLCHYCNEARIKRDRALAQAQTPPLVTTPPLATTPPPHPPTQCQPALPTGAAAAAALATVDALSQSSRGSLQQPMPATSDATPQLNQICARLEALEEICGRLETMMMEIRVAVADHGAQSQAQDGALLQAPPGLADGAPPGPQAQAPLQAQAPPQAQAAAAVVATVMAVNAPGADNGGQGSHASWTAGVQPSHSPIHPQPHKNTKHNLNKHKSNNHRHRRPLKLMREV